MRILQANKFFYRRGGAEVVFFDTIRGLRERGHEVIEFSMKHPANVPSEYAGFFAPQLPELLATSDLGDYWKIFTHLFYSRAVQRNLRALLLASTPDIAHLHNIYHHLSASTFTTLRRAKIPMILTVHDVFPLCPNHSLLYKERLREDLFKNKLYNCVRYKCVDNRLLPSLAGTLEAYYYRWRSIWSSIDAFICPSEFMADKMVEWGYPRGKMRVVRNAYTPPAEVQPLGDAIVYLGRVHFEKGIRNFLDAARRLRQYKIIIAGSGPEDEWVNTYITRYSLTHVERLPWINGEQLADVMRRTRVMVVPSLFYENCSLTILEAMSAGRLVVGSNRGGTPELLSEGKTGFLAQPENADDLLAAIKRAMELSNEQARVIGSQARARVTQQHALTEYLDTLERIYAQVLTSRR